MWLDQPIALAILKRQLYSPQPEAPQRPQLARFHPYGEKKKMFQKLRQEIIKKETTQHERNTHKDHDGFVMCDNGLNTLGAPKIFHGLRYREWMKEVWTSYQFYVQRMKEDPLEQTLSLDQRDELVSAYNKYALEDGHHPESCRALKDFFER